MIDDIWPTKCGNCGCIPLQAFVDDERCLWLYCEACDTSTVIPCCLKETIWDDMVSLVGKD